MVIGLGAIGDAHDHIEQGHAAAAPPDFNPLHLLSERQLPAAGGTAGESLPHVTLAADTLSLSPEGLRKVIEPLGISIPGNDQFPDLDPRIQRLIIRRIQMHANG